MIHSTGERKPNDPKLSDRDPEARVAARRREAKARRMPGFMAGAYAVTEPVELTAALRQLNARVAVRCSAWLGVAVILDWRFRAFECLSQSGIVNRSEVLHWARPRMNSQDISARNSVAVTLHALYSQIHRLDKRHKRDELHNDA